MVAPAIGTVDSTAFKADSTIPLAGANINVWLAKKSAKNKGDIIILFIP